MKLPVSEKFVDRCKPIGIGLLAAWAAFGAALYFARFAQHLMELL